MNERIRELAEQAEEYSYVEYAKKQTGYSREYFYNQKFAELIVRDVIDIFSVYRAKITFYDGVEHNCQHPITVIQKHFGVEE